MNFYSIRRIIVKLLKKYVVIILQGIVERQRFRKSQQIGGRNDVVSLTSRCPYFESTFKEDYHYDHKCQCCYPHHLFCFQKFFLDFFGLYWIKWNSKRIRQEHTTGIQSKAYHSFYRRGGNGVCFLASELPPFNLEASRMVDSTTSQGFGTR